jgi:hypothetical protein
LHEHTNGPPEGGQEPDAPDPNEPVLLCTRCGLPMPPDAYYCPHCSEGAGKMTPYIPYVNIRFNYGPFGDLWKTAKGETDAGPWRQLLTALLLFAMAPILLLGVPFVIVEWIRNRRKSRTNGDARDGGNAA